MESKLQQLTEKLYTEGLSKGRTQAQELVDQAKVEAAKIIEQAQAKASQIDLNAKRQAEELKKNTESEIRLMSSQLTSSLRQRIENVVVESVVTEQVSLAWSDGDFMKKLILSAVERWNPKADEAIEVVVPGDQELMKNIRTAIAEKFAQGVEVVTDSKVKVPFRIAPKGAGYYVSFADGDFDALFKSYLRPKVSELLFGKNE